MNVDWVLLIGFHQFLLARFNAERAGLEFGVTIQRRLLAIVLQSTERLLRGRIAIAADLLRKHLVADLTNHVAAARCVD